VVVPLAGRLGHRIERDSHGNVQLSGTGVLGDFLIEFLKGKFGKKKIRARADTYGYVQRCFAGCASAVDQAEARLAGRKAVEYALAGEPGGSVAFRRRMGSNYAVDCFLTSLDSVARDTKDLPRKYVNRAGNDITDAFRAYALPLVGDLPAIGRI
jgi:6-phosphofructokinase 1